MTRNEPESTALTLVLGGTGKTGRRVAERLTARGVPVRVGSRSGRPPFDWWDRSTWADAIRGVSAAYLSFYPDLAVPGAAETVRSFTELAVRGGVRRLVLLSGRGEEEAQLAERMVQDSGAEWTILRASWFNQNFSEGELLAPLREGELVLPVGDVGEPFVDADDIAEVAEAALTGEGHVGQLYELTGPRLLTFAEAVAEIAGAAGREIRFRTVPVEEYAAMLAEQKLPAEVAALLTYLFVEVLDGRNARLADGVSRALGREPRDFRDFARRAAATGIWSG
ncbi:NmrA family transcriptional regulator [Plantactinospora sp. BB1]|uniref:NmrA family transcriptional regulator n=1 Tax=Plantactinospora sp. BB1 TaxID=2071627 RepID=UPI000D1516DB|nr:NmrA family transcriptional regulator [Plantactinospora sp. BB1]AVT35867.1 NmrA family transcriptional regulator [Plantactinospora sp. BB1]